MKVFHTSFGHTIYKTAEGRVVGFAKLHDKYEMANTIKDLVEHPGMYFEDTPEEFAEYKDSLTLVFEC